MGYLPFFSRKFLICFGCLLVSLSCFAQRTTVSGVITDAGTGQAIPMVSVTFGGNRTGTMTDSLGKYTLSATGNFLHIVISAIGYQSLTKKIAPGTTNEVAGKLEKARTQLKEVSISAQHSKPYRNKDNPAVELIRRVIAHKEANRPQSATYLQYDQYERTALRVYGIHPALVNNFVLKPYRFMYDTAGGKIAMEAYLSEKKYRLYLQKTPEKSIKVLTAQKEANILKFIDTAGVNIYVNRLYGDKVDIYENNIFIINYQFLSPIADHAPDFYKFFITDTIRTTKDTLIELSFIPRNKGDLLFEGHLLVTLDGSYAVTSCALNVDKEINLNFLRSLQVNLDFEKQPSGHYFLTKTNTKADFGILKNRGAGLSGERTIRYTGYLANQPMSAEFYGGNAEQIVPGFDQKDSLYWASQRPDTLPEKQAEYYRQVGRLEKMPQFKRATWIATTLSTGYADLGPFQFNTAYLASYSTIEGIRLGLGGRTTPKFNKNIYLEGYLAEGLLDHQFKYNTTVYYTVNAIPFYRYPNNYLKFSQQYDIGLPGNNSSAGNFRTPISSFQTGTDRYYFYSRIFKLDYVKEYDNHLSFDVGFYQRSDKAAGSLTYTMNDPQQTLVDHITSSVFTLGLRYAPHEQIYQGADYRHTIRNNYPIMTVLFSQGIQGLLGGTNQYSSVTTTIQKRLYESQLGYADVTLLGGMIAGKVPYPLLNISNANQSIVYSADGYNQMHYLEFVSDHYAGFNITQNFNGFFLNKIPVIDRLKWREFLSFKILYGGLRDENNPALTSGLYNFPVPAAGASGTYALGSTPYTEAGVGIGNIFKFIRIDGIRRFSYLDHPGISKTGLKVSLRVGL